MFEIVLISFCWISLCCSQSKHDLAYVQCKDFDSYVKMTDCCDVAQVLQIEPNPEPNPNESET